MQQWAEQVAWRRALHILDEWATGKIDASRLDRLNFSNDRSDRWSIKTVVEASGAVEHPVGSMTCLKGSATIFSAHLGGR